jgi:hypothetical protein
VDADKKTSPSILYRYRALRDADADEKYLKPIFDKLELYFPSRLELNDPYECIVPDLASVPRRLLDPFIRKRATRLLQPFRLDRRQRRERIKHLLKTETLGLVRSDIQGQVDKAGILSLSERCEDILMWSHYANGHRGLCLGFASSDNDLFFGRALPVVYSAARPVFDPRDDDFRASEKVVLTKSEHWSYEREWRITETRGKGSYVFPSETLRTVIFGCRATEADKEKVRNWIKDAGLGPSLSQAVEDNRSFRLRICPIE